MTTRQSDDDLRSAHVDAEGAQEQGSVVLHEERLVAGTERLPVGRVTMRKIVVEEERTVTVTLRREDVEVIEEGREAAAPGGPGEVPAAAAAPRGEEPTRSSVDPATGELVLYAERPVITTEWVPVERVRLQRSVTQGVETVTADVAREVVEVVDERGNA